MEQFDAQQELAFIKKVMADSRRVTAENGLDYIVWGVIVALGLFGTYALDRLHATEWAIGGWIFLALWIAVMGGGWAFSLIRYLRYQRRAHVHTLAGRMLGSIWLACGIAIMMFIFIGGPTKLNDPSPVIATVLGMGFFLSGILLGSLPLKVASICWWLGAVVMFFNRTYPHIQLLIFGSMMVLFQIVPGVILYRKWNQTANDIDTPRT